MEQLSLYAQKYAYLENDNTGNSHTEALQPITNAAAEGPLFLLRFPAFPDELKFRSIFQIALNVGADGFGEVYIRRQQFVSEDFDDATVTHQTAPTSDQTVLIRKNWAIGQYCSTFHGQMTTVFSSDDAKMGEMIRRKTCILFDFLPMRCAGSLSSISLYTQLYAGTESQTSALRPHLTVYYSDADVGVPPFGPQHPMYINPHVENVLRWDYNVPESTAAELSVTAESFFWRETGASTYTEIQLTPGAKQVTIPAETFPAASSIDYFVRVTCNSGVSTDSEVETSSTADTLATATPISPVDIVVDGSGPITFRWDVSNPSGSTPTGSVIDYSTDGGLNYTRLTTVIGPGTSYTAPAGTFPAGAVKWAVRSGNMDNVYGEWSYASFVSYAAPDRPFVSCDRVPYATISWQGTGQQAWELSIDGKVIEGPHYGTDKSFTLREPLADGTHTISVRVQGIYGLWSQPGTVIVTIENTPEGTLSLGGVSGVIAALLITDSTANADYYIYRDGALIGHTDQTQFNDRRVLGSHSYYVLNRLPDGNYTRSNTITLTSAVENTVIARLDGTGWIPLRLSERSMAEQRFRWSKTHSLRHFSGAVWPVLETSPYEDLSGSYDAAFLSRADMAAFEALRGQVVIIKSREGRVVIGALTEISEMVSTFYLSAQFTIDQIHTEDYIDEADA